MDEDTQEDTNNQEEEQDQEPDDYILESINKINTGNEDTKLTDTSGSVSQKLKNTIHKRTPEQDNSDKRKKIIPDEYEEAIHNLVEEIDSIEEPTRRDKMNKIIDKIPSNVNITKINTKKCGKYSQS